MESHYHHLSYEERAIIQVEIDNGASLRSIAKRLGRSPSSISRELARNRTDSQRGYQAALAGSAYRERRRKSKRPCKLIEGTWLHRHVLDRLMYWHWSPQQIAARLRKDYPDKPEHHVSHETIYAAIYAHPRGALKKAMIAGLRQAKKRRGSGRKMATGVSFVPEEQRIIHRQEEIESRLLPGHWEGDFIKGSFNRSAVGTLVERKTRWVVLCRMDGCTATDALEGFDRQMKRLPAFLRESMTYDNGSEMARHRELSARLKMDIWFADPHAPWQRGSNENTNGLLRQFLPKSTDLSQVSQTELNDIAWLLNGRPRKTLDWMTPAEAMAEEMKNYSNRVALDS